MYADWTDITFCRIQNLHISQTEQLKQVLLYKFCRIQNLHISQTTRLISFFTACFVEFKIYISLKPVSELRKQKQFCRIQNLHISQTSK